MYVAFLLSLETVDLIKRLARMAKKLRRNGFALIVLVVLKKKIVLLSSKVNFKLELAHA